MRAIFLAMVVLASCTAYDDTLLTLGPDGETAGSPGDVAFPDGSGGSGVAGGATTGPGGGTTLDASMTSNDQGSGGSVEELGDATTSTGDATSNHDATSALDGAPTSPQPILYYKFDETSGDVVNDSSGNARTGAAIGTHTWVAGRVGNALSFDGASAFVVLPIGVVSTLTEVTIATWVQLDGSKTWQRIADFGNSTTVYMFLTPTSNAGKVQLAITTNSNPGQQLLNGTSTLPLATWKHVAVVLDGQKASVYVDGTLEGTSTITLRLADLGTTASNWLGRSQYSQDPYFKGQLDDFRIYDRALTAEQVSDIAHP